MPLCVRKSNNNILTKINSNSGINTRLKSIVDKIKSIMNVIRSSRSGLRFFSKKFKYDELRRNLLNIPEIEYIEELSNIQLKNSICIFYYSLLSCIINNFNDLFEDENDYDIFMKYCVNIKLFFKGKSYLSDSNNFEGSTKSKGNSKNEGSSKSPNRKKPQLKLIDEINKFENTNLKQQLQNKKDLEANATKKYNSFTTATPQRLLNEGVTAETTGRMLSGIDPSIYKFGALVNQKTVIEPEKITNTTGFLMRASDYEKLSQSQKNLFLNTVRSKRFAVGNKIPNTNNLTSADLLRKNLNKKNSTLSNVPLPILSQG